MTATLVSDTPAIVQFENANEGRSYPFADNVRLISTNGDKMPENIISDMRIVAPVGTNASVTSVYISANILSVCVRLTGVGHQDAALSVIVKTSEFVPYIPYRMEKLTGSEDVGGVVTFGNIEFPARPKSYRFEGNEAMLSECVISNYEPAALRRLIDDRNGEYVVGNVKLNFQSYVTAIKDVNRIKLVLKDGASSELMSDCDKNKPVNSCGATPINSINGIEPDKYKRIVLWFH